jgi:photosystem II stability/assembly factor-like uncharacterized protein
MNALKLTRYLLLILCIALVPLAASQGQARIDSRTFGAIEARHIGPAVMGGRIAAIDAMNRNPHIIYVGSAGGGLWRSTNAGTTFKPVFDKYTQSIGAVTVDQNSPSTVWVGTGEPWTRNSVSVGTGIYKTTDDGENWQLMGLPNSERISKIVVHPTNSNIVYVSAPGHLWDNSPDRGLYKTTDGGKSWNKILFVNDTTGCADIAINPQHPDTLYASTWQFRRTPYSFQSGGPGSALYKSVNGGKSWTKLTKGLPDGELGRIAIAIAPSKPEVLYAVVESKKTGLYRSDDNGESWTWMNASFEIKSRPFYFALLLVDPKDHNRLYKPGFSLGMSPDSGKSVTSIGGGVHSDLHALWINPSDPTHMLLGTDGGIYTTFDRGGTWRFLNNIPVSQFYHVSYDFERPYNVYGGLQDNGSWMGPSRSPNGIGNREWKNLGGGDGFYAYPDLTDKDIAYWEWQGGNITRLHKATRETKDIKPYPREGEPKYRFNWNTPIVFSPTNPHALYIGAQFLFRSTDRGERWERISPDLTTNDPAKQNQEESGGLTIDNSTAENHCTIFSISESPLDPKQIWVGTDDGNLQMTRNGGKDWTNVVGNVPDLPRNTWVTCVNASAHQKGTAYATFNGHMSGDMKVYVYRTTDFGASWKSLASDSIKGYAHVIREDPVNPNLLFLGTEFGLFVTVDGGIQWAQFTGNLPKVAVMDIAIQPRESDLILATHGRGILIIDDITPLRNITPAALAEPVHIFPTKPLELRIPGYEQDFPGSGEFVGDNPREAATLTYYLKERHVIGDMKIEVYSPDGKLMATLPAGKRKGINRVNWYMRMKPPKVAPSPTLVGGALFGPMVPEGTYTFKVIKDTAVYLGSVKLIPDPALPHSAADRALQQKTVMKLYEMQGRLAYIGEAVAALRDSTRERAKKLDSADALATSLRAFADRLDSLYKTLVATREGAITGEERLRERVVSLYSSVSGFGGRPTESQLERVTVLEKEITVANASFERIMNKDLGSLNDRLIQKNFQQLKVLTKEEFEKKEKEGK